MAPNQNPEQIARDNIDDLLKASGWSVQNKNKIDLNQGLGQAIREYQTDVGPADYVLFVDKKAVGVIEAKRKNKGENITTVEDQTDGYANAKLKWVNNKEPLPNPISNHTPFKIYFNNFSIIRAEITRCFSISKPTI